MGQESNMISTSSQSSSRLKKALGVLSVSTFLKHKYINTSNIKQSYISHQFVCICGLLQHSRFDTAWFVRIQVKLQRSMMIQQDIRHESDEQEKKSERFPGGWRTARPPSLQGTKPLAVGWANKSVCQDKATWIFSLEKSFIHMIIIILYNLDIYVFIYKFITSFKINRRGTPLLTNMLLGSSMFHEKRVDIAGSSQFVSNFWWIQPSLPPPPPMHFEISTDLHWSHWPQIWMKKKRWNSVKQRNTVIPVTYRVSYNIISMFGQYKGGRGEQKSKTSH